MRFLLIPFLLPFVFLTGCADRQQNKQQPNIVFILSDDVGWADLNVYDPLKRGYYETPNLNILASQGMRFTQAYANSSCSPTRAALMSGQYYPHQPVYDVGPPAPGLMIPAPNRIHNAPILCFLEIFMLSPVIIFKLFYSVPV